MTALYKPKTYQGWTRAYHVHMRNTINELPQMEFMEEEVIGPNHTPCGAFQASFDPTRVYYRRSSATGEPTGETMTQADFLEWIYSIYMQEAEARDAANGDN